MNTASENDVQVGLQTILDRLAPSRFGCRARKLSGQSVIDKPVDLEIYFLAEPNRIAIAVEVANVNTTQLVGESCRLYFDCCPLKLLILGDRNVPHGGKDQCERVLARLYGQENIRNTPARVESYREDKAIETALKELLVL